MNGYVSSAAEEPPEDRDECMCCGRKVCPDCSGCPGRDDICARPVCRCRRPRALSIPDERWQEALDDAEDAAIDDAKVRELEGS